MSFRAFGILLNFYPRGIWTTANIIATQFVTLQPFFLNLDSEAGNHSLDTDK